MAGGKQTPRQAMIGMMYLVLLAMLAMNASKDLLNAFVALDKGIAKTVESFDQANAAFYSTIDKAAASSPAYKKVQDQANEIKEKAAKAVKMMADDKVSLISEGTFTSADDTTNPAYKELFENGIPLNKDNQDIGGGYYVPGGAPSPEATDLKAAVDEFRELVIKVLDNDGDKSNDFLAEKYKKQLSTDDEVNPLEPSGPKVSWASRISEHIPLAAVTANLTLWQSYIKNAEADVVGSIASKMDGEGMVVDKATGLVQYESGYVLKGDTVSGEIFLAAYNSKSNPKIYIGVPDTNLFKKGGGQVKYPPGQKGKLPIIGQSTPLKTSNGKGVFKTPANETGSKSLTGVIEVISAKGTFYYPYNSTYMVAEPTATVAATAMNVFYIGVDNPIAVSAPGVALEDIEVRGSGLSIRKGKKPGEYVVRASRPTKKGQEISVDVMKKGGGKLGGMKFRVKRLPTPVASILGKKEGLIGKGKLKVASFIKAEMENFDFNVSVKVSSFTMTVNVGGDLVEINAKGPRLNAKMKGLLRKVRKGNKVYFENVKAKLPDGSVRKLPSIALKVK